MNTLRGIVSTVHHAGALCKVDITVDASPLSALIVDDAFALHVNDAVMIHFKETEVMLATPESRVSAQNAFIGEVRAIERGEMVSEVSFDFHGFDVRSIITTASLDSLHVSISKPFLWFVKANELTLQKGDDER
ncbi:MAG: TOBE domain-containing protein [Campylobacterales bacterium]|nr:TOBE domain-containing protein [Campylobacterales bacterium]